MGVGVGGDGSGVVVVGGGGGVRWDFIPPRAFSLKHGDYSHMSIISLNSRSREYTIRKKKQDSELFIVYRLLLFLFSLLVPSPFS